MRKNTSWQGHSKKLNKGKLIDAQMGESNAILQAFELRTAEIMMQQPAASLPRQPPPTLLSMWDPSGAVVEMATGVLAWPPHGQPKVRRRER